MEKKKRKNEDRKGEKSRLFQTALHLGSELSYGSKFSYLPSYGSTQVQIQTEPKKKITHKAASIVVRLDQCGPQNPRARPKSTKPTQIYIQKPPPP